MSFDLPGVKSGSDIEALFKVIGFIVIQWGHAEQSLDLMAANIFHFLNSHPLVKGKRRQQHLKQKIKFFSSINLSFS